jgi:hypothetical protein
MAGRNYTSRKWPAFAALSLNAFALTAIVVTQPILNAFKSAPEFFVARGTQPSELIAFAVLLAIIPPVVIIVLSTSLALLRPRRLQKASAILVAVFTAILLLQVVGRLPSVPPGVAIALALLVGFGAMTLFMRSSTFESFLRLLAAAMPVVVAQFLLTAPISGLLRPARIDGGSLPVLSSSASVVFLVLDEFPQVALLDETETIDQQRYPNIAALVSTSTFFRNAAPAHPYTAISVPALLSGELPDPDKAPTAADHPRNIFAMLSATHTVHAVEPLTKLCPDTVCQRESAEPESGSPIKEVADLGLNGLELFKRMLVPGWFPNEAFSAEDPLGLQAARRAAAGSRIDADHAAEFKAFVDEIDGTDGQFYFGHFLLPHAPYRYLPSGRSYNRESQVIPALDERGYWVGDPWDVLDNQQRLLLQVKFVDGLIGELVNRLEDLGAFDKTMIVITSDHGVSHIQGNPRRDITPETLYDIGLVPLIIKAPGQDYGIVDDRLVAAVDVLPTVADLLGADASWGGDGISLVNTPGRMQLSMRNQKNEEVAIDVLGPGRQAAIQRFLSVFGSAERSYDVFAFGPYSELVGREVSDFNVGDPLISADIGGPGSVLLVDLAAGYVPAFVEGTVFGIDRLQTEVQIAIILNGRVSAVVPLHGIDGDQARFGGVMVDDLFVDGVNTLELLTVYRADDRPTFNRVEGTNRGYSVIQAPDGGETITSSAGESYRVDDSSVLGFVDTASRSLRETILSGWAIHAETRSPVELILVFSNGTFVGKVQPELERAGLAKQFGDEKVLMSGFEVVITGPVSEVEVFGLYQGTASRLGIIDSALQSLKTLDPA